MFALLAIAGCARGQTASVAAFGALPDDGVTDATQGIQAAINAARGGRVYLPKDVTGTGAEVIASIGNGAISGLTIANPGSGYCKPPEIAIVGAGKDKARATAQIDRNCRLTSVTIERPGSGYTSPPEVHVVSRPRCYKVSQIVLTSGTMLEGDGESSCIVPDGGNKPVIFSDGAFHFRIRNLALIGDGKTDIGMQFHGATTPYQFDGSNGSDAALCTLDGVEVSGFRSKNIELDRTYGFVFLNVHSHSSGGWGLYLRDGYNNATQILGGEYSANGIGGVFIGNDSIELYFSAVAEGNAKYGIYYHGYLMGLQINDAYFEDNGHNRTGWDVYGDFFSYDKPAFGVSIRNSLFNSLDAAQAAYIQNTVDLEFSHNIGVPPLVGDPFEVNSVILGKGVVNPKIDGNTALAFTTLAGTPIHTTAANFAENVLLRSGQQTARAWIYANTGEGCPGHTPACKDGTRFQDNGTAWKVPLAAASGAANMTTITQKVSGVSAGHLIGAGAWMRTDSGTATAWPEISDDSATYTGSILNQPLRQPIDSNWRWISTNAATDSAAHTAASVTFRVYANDGSPTRAIYVFAPQAWLDVAGVPQYAQTTTAPVIRRIQNSPSAPPALSGTPDCKGAPNGIAGYDAASDKIWVCNNGIPKAH
jgi:hypothetical protein